MDSKMDTEIYLFHAGKFVTKLYFYSNIFFSS